MNVLQGVTLTDLKEARQTNSLSPQDRRAEDGGTLDERSCVRRGLTDDRRGRISLTESTETSEISAKWSKLDEVSERNVYRSHLELQVDVCESSVSSVFFSCAYSRGTLNPG